jgi:hypothetical protein
MEQGSSQKPSQAYVETNCTRMLHNACTLLNTIVEYRLTLACCVKGPQVIRSRPKEATMSLTLHV